MCTDIIHLGMCVSTFSVQLLQYKKCLGTPVGLQAEIRSVDLLRQLSDLSAEQWKMQKAMLMYKLQITCDKRSHLTGCSSVLLLSRPTEAVLLQRELW